VTPLDLELAVAGVACANTITATRPVSCETDRCPLCGARLSPYRRPMVRTVYAACTACGWSDRPRWEA